MILLSLILLNLIVPQTIESEVFIKVNKFLVPQTVRVGEIVRISCLYEISGANLHALKLFKDDKEFYRYTPTGRQEDQKMDFPIVGAKVNLEHSNERDAVIKILNKRAAGTFKCQVSVEGTFQSISAEKRMEVQDPAGRRLTLPGAGGHQQQRHTNHNNRHHQQPQQHQARQLPASTYSVDPMTSMQQSAAAPSLHLLSSRNLLVLLSSLWAFAFARL